MRTSRRRVVSAGFASIVAIFLLALGCGGGSPGTNDNANTNANTNFIQLMEDCREGCNDAISSGCPNAPADAAQCQDGCAESMTQCPAELAAVIQCGAGTTTFGCNPEGIPYPDGCQTLHNLLMACMNGIPPVCADACPAVVATACGSGPPTIPECETGCADSYAACPAELIAVFQCAGSTPTFSCSADDVPYPDGCQTQHDTLMACLGAPPAICNETCPAVVAAACPSGPSDIADCENGCDHAAATCPTQFAAIMQCAGPTPTYTCDADGTPMAVGCETEAAALNACLGI